MQLYFHVGDHKTGSSSIQRALFDGAWVCDSRSLAYPPYISAASLARALYVPAMRRRRKNLFQETADWLSGATGDVAVISAEHFSHVEPQLLNRMTGRFLPDHAETAKFLAYVRPHPGSIVSHYTQRAKSGTSPQTLTEFAENVSRTEKFEYAPRFGDWRRVFGDRFILKPMIRSELKDGDVVKDFLHEVLDGAQFALKEIPRTNESAEVYELAIIRRVQSDVQRRGFPPKTGVPLGAALADALAAARKGRAMGGRVRLHRDLARKINARYQRDARVMDAEFFTGAPLLVSALSAAEAEAAPEEQTHDLHVLFEADRLAALDQAIGALIDLVEAKGEAWTSVYRFDRGGRRNLGGKRPDVDDPQVRTQASEVSAAIDRVVEAGHDLFHSGDRAQSA